MAIEWIRRVGLIAVALFGLCVACVEPREPMEGSVPVSEGTRRDSEEAPETPAGEDLAPPSAGATVDAPCSGYPVDGTEGPYRLAAGSGIEPPKRARFEEPDARTLGLEMSDVPGPLLLEVVISKTGEVASVGIVKPAHRDFDRQATAAILGRPKGRPEATGAKGTKRRLSTPSSRRTP